MLADVALGQPGVDQGTQLIAVDANIRQVQELADFPADVQKAAAGLPDMRVEVGQRKKG